MTDFTTLARTGETVTAGQLAEERGWVGHYALRFPKGKNLFYEIMGNDIKGTDLKGFYILTQCDLRKMPRRLVHHSQPLVLVPITEQNT